MTFQRPVNYEQSSEISLDFYNGIEKDIYDKSDEVSVWSEVMKWSEEACVNASNTLLGGAPLAEQNRS